MPKGTDKPWERQKGESDKAYEAFVTYRDMGTDRSIRAVAQKLDKSRTQIGKWSSAWNWTERVRIYDNELETEVRAKAIKGRKDMTDRHIKIAMQLQKKALAALNSLDVKAMTPKDIKEFLKMATDLERLNRTLEEDSKGKNDTISSLADEITAAYLKREEIDNA